MACNDYLTFKGITNIGDTLLMSELETNLKSFFDWGMLQIGAWNDVDISTTDIYAGDFSTLRVVRDGSYTNGQVWQGARKDWIWETGVNYEVPHETGEVYEIGWFVAGYHAINLATDPSLIVQSGDILRITNTNDSAFDTDYFVFDVPLTGLYYAYSSATSGADVGGGIYQVLKNPQEVQVQVDGTPILSGYYVNYPLGQVIFDTAISTSSTVKASYSYRYVQIYNADQLPWWQELQFSSLRADDTHFTQTGDYGEWSIGGQHRIQLPTIVIEAIPRGTSKGYQLGDGSLVVNQDVLFHVITEDRHTRNQLLDICRLQNHKTIWLYNSNHIAAASGFALDYRGTLVGTKMYPDLVDTDGYRWEKCYFSNAVVSALETPNPKLYAGVVRVTAEIIFRV